ncbi:MAG: hypothetical protein WBB08_07955 [Halobacteriota archaeon]
MKTKTIAFLVIAAVVVSTAVVGIAMAAKDGQAGKRVLPLLNRVN